MSQAVPPFPEPNPPRADLEALEEKLRALAPPAVPAALESKLIASIPAAGALGRWPRCSQSTGFGSWARRGFASLAGAVVHWWPSEANSGRGQPGPAKTERADRPIPPAIKKYEDAISVDPYNAEAWFNLAKAQAAVHMTDEAVSSAQKAIDVARVRDRIGYANDVEAWLQDVQGGQSFAKVSLVAEIHLAIAMRRTAQENLLRYAQT